MDAAQQARSEKKKELLIQLAELMIEEQVEEGVFLNTRREEIHLHVWSVKETTILRRLA